MRKKARPQGFTEMTRLMTSEVCTQIFAFVLCKFHMYVTFCDYS